MKTVAEVGEFGLIDRISRLVPTSSAVVEGIGDDCAVVRVFDKLLLVSCDIMIENVHFRRSTMTPHDIGWRAAAASLSDIAAMGGSPLFSLVSLGCPADTDLAFVDEAYRGMCSVMSLYGAVIVGGDTVRTEGGLILDVTVLGGLFGSRCLYRRGARTGDLLAVTGHPGFSAAGFHALEHGHSAAELVKAHCQPLPRVAEGQWLCGQPAVHAMIDVSDGLVQDVGHVARASQLGVEIDPERLPRAETLEQYCKEHDLNGLQFILGGGEDYALAFAVDAESCTRTLDAFRSEFRTTVTVIGRFTDEWSGVRVGGEEAAIQGFDHFK